jgi:hypothetical protein
MHCQVICPKCQQPFVVSEQTELASMPCPRCGFDMPLPVAGIGARTRFIGPSMRTALGIVLLVVGLCVLVCASLVAMLTVLMSSQSHGTANVPDFSLAGAMLVFALAFIGSGIFLLCQRDGVRQYVALTQKATIVLTLTLLVGAAAFLFALVSCLG